MWSKSASFWVILKRFVVIFKSYEKRKLSVYCDCCLFCRRRKKMWLSLPPPPPSLTRPVLLGNHSLLPVLFRLAANCLPVDDIFHALPHCAGIVTTSRCLLFAELWPAAHASRGSVVSEEHTLHLERPFHCLLMETA